jgi:Zn-dependent metalloprotease
MDNIGSGKLEGSAGDGKNRQASEKNLEGSQSGSRLLSIVDVLDDAASSARRAVVGQPEASAGIIPPYMLEELSKRNPAVPHFRATMHKMDQNSKPGETSWWPFPWPSGKHNAEREVYDAGGKESLPGKKARFEGDKPTGNDEVDRAYDFTGQVRSYYKDVHDRNSIDGKGMKFVSTVNYGDNYENAFWNGKQMTYGRPGSESPFKTFILLDVCGHEITHGVTEKETGLKYQGQAGALNESLSDVFGELIEQKAKQQLAKDADWLVGKDIWKDSVKGRGLRDMLHPGTAYDDPAIGKDPQPAHMKDYFKTTRDHGGVHYNSGIPNRAFATFAVSVGGYAYDEPGKIWFAARKAAGAEPSFAQFAYQTIEQAKKLGYSADVSKLQKAWEDVGVKPSATDKDTDTPVKPATKGQVGWQPMYGDDSRKTSPAA